jgi:OOP family OmpA-OmpF porin
MIQKSRDVTEKYAYTTPSQGIETENKRFSLIATGKTNNRETIMNALSRSALLPIISAGLLAGCAGTPYSPAPYDTGHVDTSAYVAKVDAFVVVVDASSSMNRDYEDREKFYTARDVVTHMNQTIPELGYTTALVSFGTGKCVNREDALVVYGPETYVRTDFSNGLSMLECAGGYTPMSQGIHAGGEAVKAGTGKVALILVSDFWMIYDKEVMETVDALKADYGDRLCIHTIKVGDASKSGDLIAALAGVNNCGSSVDAASLAASGAMAGYVTDVLLEPAPAAVVRYEKNTLSASALFDHDKSIVKEEGKVALHALDESIKARGAKVVDIDVIGHTDSDGTEEYNMGLSIRRAEAVRDYMVSEDIDSSIIDVSGEGETNPVTSNATREGRAQNRRVDIHVGIKEQAN